MKDNNESNYLNTQANEESYRSYVESKLIDIMENLVAEYNLKNSEDGDKLKDSKDEKYVTDATNRKTLFHMLNSITYIGLVVAIEEEFNIQFNDEDLQIGKLQSLNDIIDYILKRKLESK